MANQVTERTDGQMSAGSTQEYVVTGMSCGHCESAVRSEVSELPGVQQVDVTATTGRLVLTVAEPVDDTAVLAAVDEAGYEAARA